MDKSVYETVIKVGQKLFAENDLANLCEMIIDEAQRLTNAEGGTLYLTDQQPPRMLRFSIVHNRRLDALDTHHGTRPSGLLPVPLFDDEGRPNHHHVAAYAANQREIVNVPDTYACANFDFSGTHAFDRQNGYHTQSVLAVPLINDTGELIGVLQLINARSANGAIIPFEPSVEPVVAMLASFAALAISVQSVSNSNRELLIRLAGTSETSALIESILVEAQHLTHAEGGSVYLLDRDDLSTQAELKFMIVKNEALGLYFGGRHGEPVPWPGIPMYASEGGEPMPNMKNVASYCAHKKTTVVIDDVYDNQQFDFSGMRKVDKAYGYRSKSFLTLPLLDHNKDVIGVLQLLNARDPFSKQVVPFARRLVPMVEAMATYASIALENQLLVQEHKELLDTFIQCIAKAIDAKSSHTSGHCQRVPLLTELIARAACEDYEQFATFNLDADGWYELHVAAWLHDCGKLATPDSVLDKSTKLHGLRDGMGEVNARFAALRQQVQYQYLKRTVDQPDQAEAFDAELHQVLDEIESDRAFLEQANQGGEYFDEKKVERVKAIAARTWIDHTGNPVPLLTEAEVRNLCVARGTLNDDERAAINNHIQVTIDMLESLKFPRKLRRVPEYAGGHHERMDGKGYPRGLTREQMSIPARMMAIADIFEALTAKDRPYKQPMPISQALGIMKRMRDDNHIDPDLYALFIRKNVWKSYAEKVLAPAQLDIDDASDYL